MRLTLQVTILSSTTEIQLVLSSQYTFGAPVRSAKAYMYLWIALVFSTALYMHLIYPSAESEAIYGYIGTFQQTSTPIRFQIIPETERLPMIILT